MHKAVYPHVRPCSCSRPRSLLCPITIQYFSSQVYPLAHSHSHSCSRSRSGSRYSAISLVIESEHERTGADADAHVDTLLNTNAMQTQRKCIDGSQLKGYNIAIIPVVNRGNSLVIVLEMQ